MDSKRHYSTEAFTSHGATCPDTSRTSVISQVSADQWMTE